MYTEEQVSPAPAQRKFNGDYGFSFLAAADETEAGTVILRGGLIGFSNRNVEAGQYGTAELQGTVTVSKAAATVFAVGDDVFWDTTAKQAVKTGDVRLGLCKIAPSDNATTVEVIFNAPSAVTA